MSKAEVIIDIKYELAFNFDLAENTLQETSACSAIKNTNVIVILRHSSEQAIVSSPEH